MIGVTQVVRKSPKSHQKVIRESSEKFPYLILKNLLKYRGHSHNDHFRKTKRNSMKSACLPIVACNRPAD